MKKLLIFTVLILTLAGYGCWAKYHADEFMSAQQAEKKWGFKALDKKAFKADSIDIKAPMAVDIIKNKKYVGTDMLTVRKELGDPDSYFFSDTIYAYKIMTFPGENKENWHLVFIPDAKLEKVKDVKIHKKCCYQSPFK